MSVIIRKKQAGSSQGKTNGAAKSSPAQNPLIDLPSFERPSFADNIRFPDSLIELADANISDLLGKYTQLLAYANARKTEASVRLLRIRRQEDLLTTTEIQKTPGLNHAKQRWRRDAVIESMPGMQALREKGLIAAQESQMAGAYAENYQAYVAALSRELTRRSSLPERYRHGHSPV